MQSVPESAPTPPPTDWVALRDAVRRFEDAWRRKMRPKIDDYLPIDNSLRSRSLIELVHIDLELRIKAGESARVEEYFAQFPELSDNPAVALEFIVTEHELRRRREPGLTLDEYLDRFPQYSAELPLQIPKATINVWDVSPRSEEPRPDILPEVGGFEIQGVLGHGGMGVVYRARQITLNRTVALKMVLTGPHAGPKDLARFRAETAALARLQHPNIVHIYDVGEAAGRPYFVLEFVAGGSLAQHLHGAPQPVRPSAKLIETLARAVHAAHTNGVIHRDLKPANILLVSGGMVNGESSLDTTSTAHHSPLTTHQPKITDFGLAKCASGDGEASDVRGPTVTGEVLGTPNY